mgnify:CR=1 FL=1
MSAALPVSAALRWTALVGAVVGLVAFARPGRDPGEDAHLRFAKGECADCHGDPARPDSRAPRYHQDPGWDVLHGRAEEASAARCTTCHTADACRQCHRGRPGSHTAGFVHPESGGEGARAHAALGGLRPAGCAGCHDDAVKRCVGCHTVGEARAWAEAAKPVRALWGRLR